MPISAELTSSRSCELVMLPFQLIKSSLYNNPFDYYHVIMMLLSIPVIIMSFKLFRVKEIVT